MGFTEDFIKKLGEHEQGKHLSRKFWDFCELAFCALAKLTADEQTGEALEARYMQIVDSYRDKDAVRTYAEMLGMVALEVQSGRDALGSVAAAVNALEDKQGQFFTPYEVSRLMAEMCCDFDDSIIQKRGFVTMQEPAAGAGGMVLAYADVFQRRGYQPSTQLFVEAWDISALCYWMTFVQLSYAGIPAKVIHGDTLRMEVFSSAFTPAIVPFLGLHGNPYGVKEYKEHTEIQAIPSGVEMKQLALF